MSHCASTAKVDRPLAFDAGVLPDAGTAVGVAQIHGCVCEPRSTGPPRAWLVIFRLAEGRPSPWPSSSSCPRPWSSSCPPPFESATKRLSPTRSPVSTPRSARATGSATNDAPTSTPLSVSATLCRGTFLGTRTSTRASPSLIRSARFDSVRISKSCEGRWSPDSPRSSFSARDETARSGAPPPQPGRTVSKAIATRPTVTPKRVFILSPWPCCPDCGSVRRLYSRCWWGCQKRHAPVSPCEKGDPTMGSARLGSYNLIRPETRPMVEDLRRDDQLVRFRLRSDPGEPLAHRPG